MQNKSVIFTWLFISSMVFVVDFGVMFAGAYQDAVLDARSRRVISRQQYQALLHQLYSMQHNLSKIRTNKKYCLMRSQLRRLLSSLKEKYKNNTLNLKRFNHIKKNADKLDRELHRLMTKTSSIDECK